MGALLETDVRCMERRLPTFEVGVHSHTGRIVATLSVIREVTKPRCAARKAILGRDGFSGDKFAMVDWYSDSYCTLVV